MLNIDTLGRGPFGYGSHGTQRDGLPDWTPWTPLWGGNTAWERLCREVSPPRGPPLYIPIGVLVRFWLVNLLAFWDWIVCKLITVLVIFLHVVIRTCT